jgi:hypothetical protein
VPLLSCLKLIVGYRMSIVAPEVSGWYKQPYDQQVKRTII